MVDIFVNHIPVFCNLSRHGQSVCAEEGGILHMVKIIHSDALAIDQIMQHHPIVGKLAVIHNREFFHLGNEFVLVGKGHAKRLILAQTAFHGFVGIGAVKDGTEHMYTFQLPIFFFVDGFPDKADVGRQNKRRVMVLPVIGWIFNVVAMKYYDLDKERMVEVQKNIAAMKAEQDSQKEAQKKRSGQVAGWKTDSPCL